jgi:secreted trypsin-like serine protease
LIVLIFECGNGTTYECDTKSSCGCSPSPAVLTRIIGGESVEQESWSWMISIRLYRDHICGGTILSPSFILTVAHCVEVIDDYSTVTILAGSLALVPSSSNNLYQIRSVDQIYEHADYDYFQNTNDLALIRLSTPFNMTNGNIKSICLPDGNVR